MQYKKYEELESSSYTSLRKELIRSKASPQQWAFLKIMQEDSSVFSEWLLERVEVASGTQLKLLPNPLSEDEFKNSPQDTEEQIYHQWAELTPAIACRPSFWGLVTFRNIEAERLEPSYLAANGKTKPDGAGRISELIKSQDPPATGKDIDRAVRDALRKLGGLPEPRGHRSVYVDCPLSRAWWRVYIAQRICEETPEADQDKVLEVLRISQTYWEDLVQLMVSRGSVLGDVKARNALVWALSEKYAAETSSNSAEQEATQEDEGSEETESEGESNNEGKNGKKKFWTGAKLKILCSRLGVRSAWQELGVFSLEELKEIMDGEIEAISA